MDDEFDPDPFRIGAILAAAGEGALADALLDAVQRIGPVSEVFIFRWTEKMLPQLVSVAGKRPGFRERAEAYVERYFHHDPMLFRFRGTPIGKGFGDIFRRTSIAPREYRQRCFVKPGFAEKHSFGWRWPEELIIANFYTPDEGALPHRALARYAHVALAAQHGKNRGRSASVSPAAIADGLAARFPQLSARERLVCLHTIFGRDSAGIAQEMGVGRATVLTYRRRAYQKMGVSRAGQALALIGLSGLGVSGDA